MSSVGSEILARSLHADTLEIPVIDLYAIVPLTSPLDAYNTTHAYNVPWGSSVLQQYGYREEYATVPADWSPVKFNHVHSCLRQDPDALEQIYAFMTNQTLENKCSGLSCWRESCKCYF